MDNVAPPSTIIEFVDRAVVREKERGKRQLESSNELVTEDQAAIEFARRYEGSLRFCHDAGAWYEWAASGELVVPGAPTTMLVHP